MFIGIGEMMLSELHLKDHCLPYGDQLEQRQREKH